MNTATDNPPRTAPAGAPREPSAPHGAPGEHGRDFLLDHEYDGIQEFDNPTPGWWQMLFIGTIVFSFVYFVVYHFGEDMPTIEERWAAAQVADNKRIFGQVGNLQGDEASILKVMQNEQLMSVAGSIFQSNCVSCHGSSGAAGGGLSGVNLTDDAYKNVKSLTDIFTVITGGANALAMPAWENRLNTNERVILAAYVAKLRGTNAPGGKAPEGSVVPPWPAPTPAAQ